MKRIILTTVVILGLGLIGTTVFSQDFKGIIPMKSTCKDVKKSFSGVNCRKAEYIFATKAEKIRIAFTTKKCQTFFGHKWSVPIGTVVIITRYFNRNIKEVTLEDLGIKINESEYNKNITDVESIFYYERKIGGYSIGLADGFVDSILYTPTIKDAKTKACKTK